MSSPVGAVLAVDLHDVAKRYRGKIDALRGIEMRVAAGEIFGLLGPNGAGKSTLVKIMMTIVRPTRAAGTVLGKPIGHKPTLARIGYLPENHRFPRYLTGRQAVEFFGAMSGIDRATRKRRASELVELVGMKPAADRRIGTYSKGMAQRIGLAQALVNDPELILLDEPTDGVDPIGRRDIRDVLVQLRARGKTIFINSHLLSELEMICDRVAILVSGSVAQQGTMADLTSHQQCYEIELAESAPAPRALAALLHATLDIAPAAHGATVQARADRPAAIYHKGTLSSGQWLECSGQILRLGITDPAAVQPLIDRIRSAGLVIQRVQLVRPSLEDLFMDVIQRGSVGGHS